MDYTVGSVHMGQYQIVVYFEYGNTMKYFINTCVFSLIHLEENCLNFPE